MRAATAMADWTSSLSPMYWRLGWVCHAAGWFGWNAGFRRRVWCAWCYPCICWRPMLSGCARMLGGIVCIRCCGGAVSCGFYGFYDAFIINNYYCYYYNHNHYYCNACTRLVLNKYELAGIKNKQSCDRHRYPIDGLLFLLRDMNIRRFFWHRHTTAHAWQLSSGLTTASCSRCQWLCYRLIQHLDKPILILCNNLHMTMQQISHCRLFRYDEQHIRKKVILLSRILTLRQCNVMLHNMSFFLIFAVLTYNAAIDKPISCGYVQQFHSNATEGTELIKNSINTTN